MYVREWCVVAHLLNVLKNICAVSIIIIIIIIIIREGGLIK